MPSLTAWVLTDGKAGDEGQCLALTEALGIKAEIRRVRPRAPFTWAMPWGPIDPGEAPGRPGSPLAPPFLDLAVASGRRAVAYLRAVKRASTGRAFTVFLKDPRIGPKAADLIWVPAHDRLRAANVIVTQTPPHRVSPERLAEARTRPDPRLALPAPRVAVLVGGSSRHHRFAEPDCARFLAGLTSLVASDASLMITVSRRTPTELADALRALTRAQGFFYDGTGDNPYVAMLALADAVVATADSYNMVGEAVATGRPVLVFEPEGGHPKLDSFLDGLKRHGAVKPFLGHLEAYRYEPLDATPAIAAAVLAGLQRHRRAFGLPDPG